MSKWMLPWLVPVGLVVVVIVVATASSIGAVVAALVGAALAVVVAFLGVPLVYRAYQANRPGRTGDARNRRPDPPNNRSLLR